MLDIADCLRKSCAAIVWSLLLANGVTAATADLATARNMLLTGKYAEAEEAYDELLTEKPVDASLGKARCQAAVGEYAKALAGLRQALEKNPASAALSAEIAILSFETGDYGQADTAARAALKADGDQVAAQFVLAELARLSGKLDEANELYQALVEQYNNRDVEDPEVLRWIGRAAAQFARWNRLSDQFGFLVNELYPEALSLDDSFWPAHYESGLLFLEKYNQADAGRALQKALKINPNAADLHAALARLAVQGYELDKAKASIESALAVNPRLLAAHLAQADIHFANVEPAKAIDALRAALPLNPRSDEALGALAAACLVVDGGSPSEPGVRAQPIIAEVEARNDHAGNFYLAMADTFDLLRRYPLAAHYYEVAATRMPQLTEPSGQLGLMLMRLGEEEKAQKLLDESFKIDPFNVRVLNTLKVLEVLESYETLETEHYVIKFDGARDRILARYAARYLEDQYPQLCKQLGYEPPDKSLFEIFNKAKNSSGHNWFAARMVGLPTIHTIGACAGKMVAMQSPTEEGAQKFNWARVLKHEFIHVINLQQSNFNIPHWYTEALATLNEGYPRPAPWNRLLKSRFESDKLFTLDTINLGFIRPHSSDDWTMAYCQAELYAEFMLAQFGEDALAKLLAAYGKNLTTSEAVRGAFGIEPAEFEKQFQEHARKVVAQIPGSTAAEELTAAEIERKLEVDKDNLGLQSQLALAYLNRRRSADAGRLARQVLAKDAKQQLAAYVQARLQIVVGENEAALKLLADSLDEAAPQANHLALLAGIRLKAEEFDEASRLYELGVKHFPGDDKWIKSLAQVYLKTGNDEKLAGVLEQLVSLDFEEVSTRKKLAQLYLEAKNFDSAARYATEAMQIDVMDADLHEMLAQAQTELGKFDDAVFEHKTLVMLDPDSLAVKLGLAQAQLKAGRKADAKQTCQELIKLDAENEQAKQLLEQISE